MDWEVRFTAYACMSLSLVKSTMPSSVGEYLATNACTSSSQEPLVSLSSESTMACRALYFALPFPLPWSFVALSARCRLWSASFTQSVYTWPTNDKLCLRHQVHSVLVEGYEPGALTLATQNFWFIHFSFYRTHSLLSTDKHTLRCRR